MGSMRKIADEEARNLEIEKAIGETWLSIMN